MTGVIAFKDVEFSLDHPTEVEHDAQRGPGNWRLIHEQAARCRRLGVPVTFIAVMMRSNFDRLADIARIVESLRCAAAHQCLSVGPLRCISRSHMRSTGAASRRCSPAPRWWRSASRWCGRWPDCRRGWAGCGVATVRVTPRATVQPCVYWPGGGAPLDLLLDLGSGDRRNRGIRAGARGPDGVRSVQACRRSAAAAAPVAGSCAAGIDEADPYCPIVAYGSPRNLQRAHGRGAANSRSWKAPAPPS